MRDLSSSSHCRLIAVSYPLRTVGEPGPEASWGLEEGDEIIPGRHAMRLLGGGLTYEAYVAWDDDLLCPAVVKILRPDRTHDARALAGLAAEAALLERLAHPSLVRLLDAVPDGERPHLLLELVEGPRLSTLERRYGIAIEQALSLGLSLASVLHYLSMRETVHLEVKPRNIIMSGPPRLIDLSVARRFFELAAVASPIGTDAYMAPEQCDPERFHELGPAADVWGLGVTLYEALAGRLPFPARPGGGRFPQLDGQPDPLDLEPPELAELLFGCLADRPSERPTAAELAAGLEPLVAELPRPRLGRFRPGGRLRSLPARVR